MNASYVTRSPVPTLSRIVAGTAAALLGIATLLGAETNTVPNPSFEQAGRSAPTAWRIERWAGQGNGTHANTGHTGARSVEISSTSGADMAWAANVPVEPFAHYRLSGWIKTKDVKPTTGKGAQLNLHGLDAATAAVTGTTDWTSVQVEFDTEDSESVQINCLFGGWGEATGQAWFDDIEVTQLSKRPVPSPGLTIDAAQVRERMSPRIYSQFIEHLGRCIYGGIWAEMLEDRKFYHRVTSEYAPYRSLRQTDYPVVGASPWQITGEASGLTMNTNRPFVGSHTPQIRAGTGIRQLDLGITATRTYTGYAWLKAADGSAEAEVSLRWADGPTGSQSVKLSGIGSEYKRFDFSFTAGATTDKASLELGVRQGTTLVGTLSLMPSDNVEGLRADTLALLKELEAPIYRWPGGNFVSGYDWRDGVGDRDRRPPRTNPAWTGVEHNDFGMHEFIRFCKLVGTEPWITVNTGFGDAYSAAAELEYANGAATTLYGAKRAANGSPAPFAVKYWGIGNEMWGAWQLGYMQLGHYIIKQNWVVDKMREVDPNIICISSGNAGEWSSGLLKGSANHMNYIAEHFYCQERTGLRSHVRQIAENIRRKAEFHRDARTRIPELKGKDIRIAMTEWNYWYGPHVFGELGTRYFLKDALGIASGLHEYARQSDIVDSAFYAQTVNVIGAIKVSRRNAAFETTGLVLKLYRKHFGEVPVTTTMTGLVDAQAAWSQDRKTLTIGIVNPTLQPMDLPVSIKNARLKGGGKRWQIAGTDPQAYNDPDQPAKVSIQEEPVAQFGDRITLAPCSITVVNLDAE